MEQDLSLQQWDAVLSAVDELSTRRFPRVGLRESAAHWVFERLMANDRARVLDWKGQGRFDAFIRKVVSHELTNFQRMRLGRPRLPVRLANRIEGEPLLGRIADLASRDGLSRTEIVSALSSERPVARKTVERLVGEVFACLRSLAPTETSRDGAELDWRQSDAASERRWTDQSEWLSAQLLDQLLDDDSHPSHALRSQGITQQEVRYLRARYVAGCTIAQAARQVGVRTSAYRFEATLRRRLKPLFER
ncbi:MAG: hypothetical protein AAF493_02275 [Pseudomonadota bacterium]